MAKDVYNWDPKNKSCFCSFLLLLLLEHNKANNKEQVCKNVQQQHTNKLPIFFTSGSSRQHCFAGRRACAGHEIPRATTNIHLSMSRLFLILNTSWRYFAKSLSFSKFFSSLKFL